MPTNIMPSAIKAKHPWPVAGRVWAPTIGHLTEHVPRDRQVLLAHAIVPGMWEDDQVCLAGAPAGGSVHGRAGKALARVGVEWGGGGGVRFPGLVLRLARSLVARACASRDGHSSGKCGL